MNNEKVFLIILILSGVTIFFKLFPLFIKIDTSSPKVRIFFKALPFAALSSLIFPDIFTSTGNVKTAVIGSVVSFFLAYKKVNLGINILISVLIVYAASFLM